MVNTTAYLHAKLEESFYYEKCQNLYLHMTSTDLKQFPTYNTFYKHDR